MQETVAPTASEVVELLKAAMDRGHVVIIPRPPGQHHTAPPISDPPLVMTFHRLLGLSRSEALALVTLMENPRVAKEQLHAAMARDGKAVTKPRIVDVVVCKLRRKLAPRGIEVDTLWGQGFALAEGARDKLHKLLAGHTAEAAPPPRGSQGDAP